MHYNFHVKNVFYFFILSFNFAKVCKHLYRLRLQVDKTSRNSNKTLLLKINSNNSDKIIDYKLVFIFTFLSLVAHGYNIYDGDIDKLSLQGLVLMSGCKVPNMTITTHCL